VPIIDIDTPYEQAPSPKVKERTNLPDGTWLLLPALPPDTTARELSAWFARMGLNMPVENISCREYCTRDGGGVNVLLSLPKETEENLPACAPQGSRN
jgi:hypothetical protein